MHKIYSCVYIFVIATVIYVYKIVNYIIFESMSEFYLMNWSN